MRPLLLVLIVGAPLALAACGDQTKDVEKSVADLLGERGYADVAVNCPESVEVKAGTSFDCEVTNSDDLASVTIRINDDEGQDLTLESAQPK